MAAQRQRVARETVRLAEESQEGDPYGSASEPAVLEEERLLPGRCGWGGWRRRLCDEELEFAFRGGDEVAGDIRGEGDKVLAGG